MENIVYLLGAGFSAPLGLPVMSNFLTKSKDMFALNSEKYGYFNDIYDTIDEMHRAKSYYNTDLLNIEEILSILEMQKYLGQTNKDIEFKSFIAAVIDHFTPQIKGYQAVFPGNWYDVLFGADINWNSYGCFLANLINLELRNIGGTLSAAHLNEGHNNYYVVTLNYDMVLENAWNFIRKLTKRVIVSGNPMNGLEIAKLHGSADNPDTIISPTWNKISNKFPKKDWEKARLWLSNANHIRIIGYSLPITDSYIKYLLKAAVLDSFNLKTIDIICLDRYDDVRKRYDEFIEFGSCTKFCNANSLDYLKNNFELHRTKFRNRRIKDGDFTRYEHLEEFHEEFMESNSIKPQRLSS